MDRLDWDTYFMNIAQVVATRSTCPRASVGAVIVRNNKIISTGYNGAPPGESHCDKAGCLMINDHCERTVHAETNAIIHAERSVQNATMYIWSKRFHTETPYDGDAGASVGPCIKCRQVMQAAGIIRVVT